MEENHRIAGFEKILGRCSPASPSGKIIDEAHGLILQGDGSASGGDEHDMTLGSRMLTKEVGGQFLVSVEGRRWCVGGEVVVLDQLRGAHSFQTLHIVHHFEKISRLGRGGTSVIR